MTQQDRAQSEVPKGRHPYVCPRCERRTGVFDLGRAVSICAVCRLEWRGPRLVVTRPPVDEADQAAWAESVVRDLLGDE